MKIQVGEEGTIVLTEVFNSVVLRTEEGEELVVCMRDGAFEIATLDTMAKSKNGEKYYTWYSANGSGITQQVFAEAEEEV